MTVIKKILINRYERPQGTGYTVTGMSILRNCHPAATRDFYRLDTQCYSLVQLKRRLLKKATSQTEHGQCVWLKTCIVENMYFKLKITTLAVRSYSLAFKQTSAMRETP
jgi:hypothetical protein